MFELLSAAAPDPILGLTDAFRKDPREDKINLTIGVYMNDQGQTPVLDCVKAAEAQLLSDEQSKGYLGITGLPKFGELVCELVLGGIVPPDRIAVTQTPGGTGALRVAADFLAQVLPAGRIWCTTPTWPNHNSVFASAGLETLSMPYLAEDRRSLDFPALLAHLEDQAVPGDVICLHACCHNPTGVDPSADQWRQLAEFTASRDMLPLVDFAYHGFGQGLEQDRQGLKILADKHEELLVCSSYSKNFGLYSERVGALLAVAGKAESISTAASRIKQVVRCNYSNPPRHGGAIVATILDNPELRQQWEGELSQMRQRIQRMRQHFVEAMQEAGCQRDFSFLLSQSGMFSFSGLTPLQVDWLKKECGIYIVGSGRINIAGITDNNLGRLAACIAKSLEQ